jgi:hypothetical protein
LVEPGGMVRTARDGRLLLTGRAWSPLEKQT